MNKSTGIQVLGYGILRNHDRAFKVEIARRKDTPLKYRWHVLAACLLFMTFALQVPVLAGITLDHVDGSQNNTDLIMGETITFHFRLHNDAGGFITGNTNGIRLYSPDGAQWLPPDNEAGNGSAEWSPLVDWTTMYAFTFVNLFSMDGLNADTIGFAGLRITEPGIGPGFNDIAWTITTGVDYPQNAGKTLCLDSTWYRPSGKWLWSIQSTNFCPSWDGPHCFTIIANDSVEFSGYLKYLDPVPPDTTQKPMRHVKIEMWDDDPFPFPDDLLADTITDDNGFFVLGPVLNDDMVGTQDVFFRIYAENEACYVRDSYSATETYRIQTANVDDIPSGVYDTTIVATFDESGFFYSAEHVLLSYEKWNEVSSLVPERVRVVIPQDTLTAYGPGPPPTIVLSRVNYSLYGNMFPDHFDASVIVEEYGHHLQSQFAFLDQWDPTGTAWSTLNTPVNYGTAEAWTIFWSCYVLGDSMYYNWALNSDTQFTFYSYYNLENGGYGDSAYNISFASVNNYGTGCIGSITGMLWDIYDNADDDYSTFGSFPQTFPFYNPDGIGDTLSDGIDNILVALLDRTVNGHHPDNMDEFWEAWFQSPSLAHCQAMTDIWYEHGDSACCTGSRMASSVCNSCCVGTRGDVNGDGSDLDIVDMTCIVDFLWGPGCIQPCPEEADPNGDGSVSDLIDLTFITDWLFGSAPALVACP